MLTPVSGKKVEYDIRPYKSYRRHIKEEPDTMVKAKVATGSIAGTLIPMALLAKHQKCKIYNIKYNVKEMIFVTTGSILGGLAAGLIADKKEHTILIPTAS